MLCSGWTHFRYSVVRDRHCQAVGGFGSQGSLTRALDAVASHPCKYHLIWLTYLCALCIGNLFKLHTRKEGLARCSDASVAFDLLAI